jgi:hypothetical protein
MVETAKSGANIALFYLAIGQLPALILFQPTARDLVFIIYHFLILIY